ncbi:MAG TPA: serpin family protein [bacterium]|nr:serpin family protein [bacterium]HPM45562.1 serpin family protein [bacterium]HPV21147.1 serpin family protein [bacterium]
MKVRFAWLLVFVFTTFFVSCENSTNSKNDETVNDEAVTDDMSDDLSDEVLTESDETNDEESAEIQLKYKESDEKAEAVENDLVNSNTEFALKMFKALLEADKDKNVFISPVSISVALAMTMNGAADETFDGMMEALEFAGLTLENVNESFLLLLESLEYSDKDVLLTLANSIWIAPAYKPEISESFIESVEKYYLSGVFEATSPEVINKWIEDHTGGHIKDMIKEFPDLLVMYLVNAIYFKGAWTTTFDKDDTYETDFTKEDDSTVKVNMMAFKDMAEYESYVSEKVVGIRLPYGREKISFYAFAPIDWDYQPIDEFINSLDQESFDEIIGSFDKHELGGVHLPKFKLEYEKELNEILKAFGMDKAFSGGFDNMVKVDSSANPYISLVKHKSFIEVSEEGTEAAAATIVEIVDESMPTTFMANRPFFFVIRDDRNGTILFMGKVADPS